MLFRQMIVEYQQIAPVIDRRRTMLPNDPTTRFAACATVIGIHHTERRSCPGSPSRSSRQILRRKIPGQDHHVVRTRTIQAKSRIFRIVFPPRRNLQTTSALVDHKRRIAFFKLCIRQSPNRFGFALHISQTSGSRNRERRSATAPPAGERFRPDAGHRKGSALRRAVYET